MSRDDQQEFEIFFKKDLIFRDVEWADAATFFRRITDILMEKGYVKNTFYQAITEREKNYPTGLQTASIGVAIPHSDPVHLKKPFISVIRPENTIEFLPMGGLEGKIEAKLIFVLGVMRNGLQVKVLQKIMYMLSDQTIIDALLHAESNQKILEIIKGFFVDRKTSIN